MHGKGTFLYHSGEKYDGDWVDDKVRQIYIIIITKTKHNKVITIPSTIYSDKVMVHLLGKMVTSMLVNG